MIKNYRKIANLSFRTRTDLRMLGADNAIVRVVMSQSGYRSGHEMCVSRVKMSESGKGPIEGYRLYSRIGKKWMDASLTNMPV